MASESAPNPNREVVGVFATAETFLAAIDKLESSGFDQAEISVLAGKEAVERHLGHLLEHVEDVEDDTRVPRRAFVAPEAMGDAEGWLMGGLFYIGAISTAGAVVASGGTMLAMVLGAAAVGGSGGLIGALLARWLHEEYAEDLQEQIDRGGLILWVHARDGAHEKRAQEILKAEGARDVHVHGLAIERPKPV